MTDEDRFELTPLGESVMEAFIKAYMKKYPDLTRDQVIQKLLESAK